jgi:DNA-binding CsgD family transcriptional regulator
LPAIELSCDAELERAAGRATTEPWQHAAAAWQSLREPYPQACCLARAVEAALAERRAKPEIASWLSCAQELATELGAAPLLQTLESAALRGRVTMPRQRPAAPVPGPAAPLGLTPREIDVLRLVGQGYTNVRIAETLFISRKTAAAHVSNILGKLEVGRRAEAAAIAARLGLLDEPAPQVPRS